MATMTGAIYKIHFADGKRRTRDGHHTVTDMAVDKPSRYGHRHTHIRTVGIWSTTSTVSMVNNTVVTAMCMAVYSQSK